MECVHIVCLFVFLKSFKIQTCLFAGNNDKLTILSKNGAEVGGANPVQVKLGMEKAGFAWRLYTVW